MFNSREYEWNDVTVIIGGVDIKGIRGVKISEKTEQEGLYAKGGDAHSIQKGNTAVSGSVTLTQSAKEALNIAGGGSLTKIRNATIVVMYGNPSQGMIPLTKTVTGVAFSENNDELKQGDKFMETEVPYDATKVVTK